MLFDKLTGSEFVPVIPFFLSRSLVQSHSLAAHGAISSFPRRRKQHEYAGADVYNVNTTPAVIDSVREMSPLGFSDVYAGEW